MKRMNTNKQILTGCLAASLAAATVASAPGRSVWAQECAALRPQVSQGTGNVIQATIGPTLGFNSHGNTFYLVERPIKSITVILTPISTDSGVYPTQLVSRYNDDSIYESGAPVFTPSSLKPFTWGPLKINQPGKNLVAFNVKILENFHLHPRADSKCVTSAVA